MPQNAFTMYKLASQGYCCSQILILMDLQGKGIENYDLVRAMAGLCIGTGGSGKTCGIVTGGACLMGTYAGKGTPEEIRDNNLNNMIMEYIEWFEEENESLDCCGIVGVDNLEDIRTNMVYPVKCGNLMSMSYKKIIEILNKYGYAGGEEE